MRNHLLRAAAGAAGTAASSGGGGTSYVTDDLVFHVDAGNSSCYSGSGTPVYNLVNNHANDYYSANYSTSNGGYWSFQSLGSPKRGIEWDMSSGTPDYSSDVDLHTNDFSLEFWMRPNDNNGMPLTLTDGGNTLEGSTFYVYVYDSSSYNVATVFSLSLIHI